MLMTFSAKVLGDTPSAFAILPQPFTQGGEKLLSKRHCATSRPPRSAEDRTLVQSSLDSWAYSLHENQCSFETLFWQIRQVKHETLVSLATRRERSSREGGNSFSFVGSVKKASVPL